MVPPPRFGLVFWLWALLLCIAAGPAWAGQSALVITSNRLEMNDRDQSAVFSGRVLAEEGSMRLQADRMTVFYVSPENGRQAAVREIRAEGNVRVRQDQHRGQADVAHYRVSGQTLELVGAANNAVVQHREDRLEGQRIILTLGANRQVERVSVRGGGNQRVRAHIASTPREEPAASAPPPEPASPPTGSAPGADAEPLESQP